MYTHVVTTWNKITSRKKSVIQNKTTQPAKQADNSYSASKIITLSVAVQLKCREEGGG